MKHLKHFEQQQINNKLDNINVIVDSYLETALWISDDRDEFDNKTIYDFSYSARKQAESEIKWFINNAGDIFDEVSTESIGCDLWLSRNGRGSGFFDRDGYDKDSVDFLMHLSTILGEIDIYVNDKKNIDFDVSSEKYKNFDVEKYKKEMEFQKIIKKYKL